jgi:PAS domain-containing protein
MPGADSAALHHRANEALSQIQKSSLMQRDDPTDRYFVARPFRSILSDRWLIAVSRRLADRDGSFTGAAVALIDQSYFIRAYRSIDVGPRGAVAMADYSGHVFAREPPIEPDAVATIRWPVASHLPMSDEGNYETVSPVNQTPRIVGYKSIPVPPLVVLVSYHRDDQLASWYQHLYRFGPGALLVISVILLGTGLLMWQTGNLAYKNRILEVTLENMAHGLCMFDGQHRLIVCNERYARMYGLSPRAHAEPRRRRLRARRRRRRHPRRPHPLAAASALPRAFGRLRCRQGAGGGDSAAVSRALLRHRHAVLRDAFPVPVMGTDHALGRRVQVRAARVDRTGSSWPGLTLRDSHIPERLGLPLPGCGKREQVRETEHRSRYAKRCDDGDCLRT